MIDPKLMDRVSKLLTRANHSKANEHEALVCIEKAQKLLLDHNMTLEDFDHTHEKKSPGVTHEYLDPINEKEKYWVGITAKACAVFCFCEVFYITHNEAKNTLVFIGTKENITASRSMFEYLVRQLRVIGVKYYYTIPEDLGEKTKTVTLEGIDFEVPHNYLPTYFKKQIRYSTFIYNFLAGAAARVSTRLNEIYWNQRKNDKVTAMVVNHEDENRKYRQKDLGYDYVSKAKHKNVDSIIFSMGSEAGNSIALGVEPKLSGTKALNR